MINKADGSGYEFRHRRFKCSVPVTGLTQAGTNYYQVREVIQTAENSTEFNCPFYLTIDKFGVNEESNRIIDIFWGGPYLSRQAKYRERMWEKQNPTPSNELCYRLMPVKGLTLTDEAALDIIMKEYVIPMRDDYDKAAFEDYYIGEHGIEKKGE